MSEKLLLLKIESNLFVLMLTVKLISLPCTQENQTERVKSISLWGGRDAAQPSD